MSSKVFTHHQSGWDKFLSEFQFTITQHPGRLATLPDSLACGDYVYPERGVEYIDKNPQNSHQILKKDGIQESRLFSIKVDMLSVLKQVVMEELESEIRQFTKYVDRNRTITPYFQPGNKVWLASEPVKQSTISNQHQLPPPPAIVEEQEEWELAQFLDSKLKRGKLLYLLKWKGFSEDPERENWKPASNLTSSPDPFKDFHTFYPDKPGPNTSRVLFYGSWWGVEVMKLSSSPGMHL
ncbi:hypothetical protein O181_018517 [Austropuccinia psidii MF-1]|uniref:Chromo domain-containing protein n=1 Tax=Austropuccinia psidii MF-1 TaxID=1389203 RepID=A0A9Q3C9R2_9BASI|nr:hypothetical protein [Austropuccinia psidii MF-1]